VRIAISGSHRVGKSTLVEALAEALAGYGTVEEPYHQLAEEGHELAASPSVEDFELQLRRSIEDLRDGDEDVLFDRCPLDLLAYLRVHEDADLVDLDGWLPTVVQAIARLDLVVFVPIEEPDRISLARSEDDEQRRAVDEELRGMLLEDRLGLEVDVVEVTGGVQDRVAQVLSRVDRDRARRER
jgi:predicted ATPase